MAANPDPEHISAAFWWFWEQLHAMEPTTQLGGFYAPKGGYHNTRHNLLNTPSHPEWRNDYSIRLTADRLGPATKSAAMDWTFPEAHGGDYRRIAMYGARIREAFQRRDPRLAGWREFLGQSDTDLAPEGYDFVTWTTRQPDDTHRWHGHFSILRQFIESFEHMRNMLLVLGWDGIMGTAAENQKDFDAMKWRVEALIKNKTTVTGGPTQGEPNLLAQMVIDVEKDVDDLKERPPVQSAPVDPIAVQDAVRTVMLEPTVMAAYAKAINDDAARRAAE